MEDTELKVEEQAPQATEAPQEQVSTEELIKNYETIVKNQQAQIEQLMKQQEVNKKIQAQNAEILKDFVNKEQQDDRHWVDKVLDNELKFEAKNDPTKNYSKFMNGTGRDLASWWLQYYKEQGLSNEEISSKYKRMAESMTTGVQPHEEIPSD